MPNLILLVGPPGSGKSTYAQTYELDHVYISQDVQGKSEHLALFKQAIAEGKDVIVDRMNFSEEQRYRYLILAQELGYHTTIVVLHEPFDICLQRCLLRTGHPTITNESHARSALKTFFTKYERPQAHEADVISFKYSDGPKFDAVICDLDGTLCNIDHRLHHVKGEGKKNWRAFFQEMTKDKLNDWCEEIIQRFSDDHHIVFCSGRSDEFKKETKQWLLENTCRIEHYDLYMRRRDDFRKDNIIKEIILDFEILTRYRPIFAIDDRTQVVDMWRSRGIITLQCEKGDF